MSRGAKSLGGRSEGGRGKGKITSKVLGGDKFRSKKAQGDAKKGALEPFAYWPMDRKMLNRRKAKQKVAQKELGKVVRSAKRQRQG